MPVIDLTYPIAPGMPVFPGSPIPEIHPIARFERDGFREKQMTFSSHTGTHMDAPSHMLRQGKTLDQFPAEHFIGAGLCIDLTSARGGVIEWTSLQPFQETLPNCDFVMLRTGWGQFWGTNRYFQGYPVLSPEAAQGLATYHPKAVGVDTLSVDAADAVEFPVHHILLEHNVLIIENLAHLDRLPNGRFGRLCCLPLPLADADGAPARVVALLENRSKDVNP
jgi:kynurenine formamidase